MAATAFEIGNGDLSQIYSTYRYQKEARFTLKRKYYLYGFSAGFHRTMLKYFLPMPVIPSYDNFMMFIVSFLNKIYFIDDSCAIHRWSGEHNVSSIGNQQPFVVRQYYRTKMLLYVCWRIIKNYFYK